MHSNISINNKKNLILMYDSEESIVSYLTEVPTVPSDMLGREVKEIFGSRQDAEGIVVTEGKEPLGIIMRTTFFQSLGSLYGNSLFLDRPIKILVDTEALSIDIEESITELSQKAMQRQENKLYDYILVKKNQEYLGVISIRHFLLQLSKRNEAQLQVLQSQHQKLQDSHKHELRLKKDLVQKTDAIKNLLDHAGQGFLMFGENRIIDDEFSQECVKIFGKEIGGEHIGKLLSRYFIEDENDLVEQVLAKFFANTSEVMDNVILQLLPDECMIEDRVIDLEYKRVMSNDEKALMVILNDITKNRAMEQAVEQEQQTQKMIIKVLNTRTQVKQMIEDFLNYFSVCFLPEQEPIIDQYDLKEQLNQHYRSVHTFKGDFAQYGMLKASAQMHFFEDQLDQLVECDNITQEQITNVLRQIDPHAIIKPELETINTILGEDLLGQKEHINIPAERIESIKDDLKLTTGSISPEHAIKLIERLTTQNLKQYLEQYRDYVNYLSQRLLKAEPYYIVEGDDVFIDPKQSQPIIRSLTHIFRNIMDHGIESPEDRLSLQKREQGLIICELTQEQDTFTLRISDDGHGIDLSKLKEKAILTGMIAPEAIKAMTHEEVLELIFSDHFSTKETTDTISGRGVGMAAVKMECDRLGGSIKVKSEPQRGTVFIIELPNQS